ncbi:MAG TPA: HlyD family efflux transporter periplasmic adaptor subunit [Defluviitaleaceae bacterium]|nr:HlyD family efflux transporter periplasmic adaptor subunit [Defluviitaleaceae bacterium]
MEELNPVAMLKKKILSKIILVFLSVMLLLTFFSKTIINLSLPQVKSEKISGGNLLFSIRAEGQVLPDEIREVYSKKNLRIKEILVEEGDQVEAGDTIILLEGSEDSSAMEKEIQLKKLQLQLEEIKNQPALVDLSIYEKSLEEAKRNLDREKENYEKIKTLYESGAESAKSLQEAEYRLEDSRQNYELSLSQLEQKKLEKDAEEKERILEIKKLEYDMELIRSELEKDTDTGGRITAPCSGIIQAINCRKGALADAYNSLCSIINTTEKSKFVVEVNIDEVKYLRIGEQVDLKFSSFGNKVIKGQIEKILGPDEKNPSKRKVVISYEEEKVLPWEWGTFYYSSQSPHYKMIIPKKAVGEEMGRNFVYVLKSKETSLGEIFYAEKKYIEIEQEDFTNCAVSSGLDGSEEIIVYSSKPLFDGIRVRKMYEGEEE